MRALPLSTFLGALALAVLPRTAGAVGVAARVNTPKPVGTEIEFAANGVGEGEVTFVWDFGDGTKSEESPSGTTTHVYENPGHYPVIVVARDATGSRSDSFLQAVHRPIPATPPASSSTIVHHRGAQLVCTVNLDNDTASCLSTETREVLFESEVGDHPTSLAVAGDGNLWVVGQGDSTIQILSPEGERLEKLSLPRAARPTGIVMGPGGERAWVTLEALGEVAEFDVAERKLVRRAPALPWAHGIALDSTGRRLFVTRFLSTNDLAEIVELSTESLEVVRRFPLGMDPGPDTEASARGIPNYLRTVVPSPDESFLWIPSKKDNVLRGTARDGLPLTFETSVRTIVSLLDLEANEERLERRIDLNNRALGLSATFAPLGDYAFVGLLGNNGVQVVDAYDGSVVGGLFDLGKAPDGLVFDDAGHLYVNSFLSRSVVILDAVSVLLSLDTALEVVDEIVVSTEEKLEPEVLRGKQIFYDAADPRMSQDGYISCASCHLDGFEDGLVWDFTDRGEGLRNTTSLLGKRGDGQGRLHWTGNFDEIQDFEHDIRGAFGGTGFLSDEDFESGTTNETLGDAKAGRSEELDALARYLETLDTVPPSPYRDEDGSLTNAGWRGLAIFEEAGCPECHSGPDFTDSTLEGVRHDVGTIVETSGQRLKGPLDGLDTPTLRGLWQTAPYLHDGSAATLLDVVGPRNSEDRHGRTSELSDEEREDLVAYLLQIDNTALDAEVEPEPEPTDEEEEPSGGGCSVARADSRSSEFSLLVGIALLLGVARLRSAEAYSLRGRGRGRRTPPHLP